jgi:SAM-dependent methyltransferase
MFPPNPDRFDPAFAAPERLPVLLQQVAERLAQIAADIARATPADVPSVLAENRGSFYRTMDALGRGIADFLTAGPSQAEIAAARAQVAAPIRAWSATSPIFVRLVRPAARGPRDFEVPALILQNHRVGADISSLIFNDYYLYSFAAQALRNRFDLLTRRLLREVSLRAQAGDGPVRLLNLKCDTGSELVRLAGEPAFAAAQVTCLDEDSTALRAARASLDKRLALKARFVRIDALKYARSPHHRPRSYAVAYAAALWDYLTDRQALALLRDCYDLLEPGGVLILGCPTHGVPVGERLLGAWVLDLVIHYRDEPDIRRLLAQTPFGAEAVQCEREPLGGDLLVSASRP